jgi:hypothetical protein
MKLARPVLVLVATTLLSLGVLSTGPAQAKDTSWGYSNGR